MPSSATITAFYEFSANTKARASQANQNFSNFRGHIIPIEPLTATASNLSHDLGSTEHRWRTGYIKEVYFGQTTTSWRIYDNTSSAGDLIFAKNGTELFRVSDSNSEATMTAGFTSNPSTMGAVLITASSLSIQAYGRPIEISIVVDDVAGGLGFLSMASGVTNTAAFVYLVKDGTTSTGIRFLINGFPGTTEYYPATSCQWVITPTAGAVEVKLSLQNASAVGSFSFTNVRLMAKRI